MELNKCAKCGKLFASSEDLCTNCLSRDLQDLGKVRDFIIEHPEIASLDQISTHTMVSSNDILRYINKGRLDDIKHLGKFFKCTYCSEPIVRGKYCDKCMEKFNMIKKQFTCD